MTFQDFDEPSREVALRLSIEGNGVNIRTKQNILFNNSVTLIPGVPYFASGNLLEPYLRYENIEITGYPRSTFEQSGKIPEGQYSFCAEVIDKLSGEVLSDKICAQVWIQLNDEPNFVTPMCGEVLDPTIPINLPIQWQLGNNISLNSLQIDYQLTLFEVTEQIANPSNAISNGNVVQVYQSMWGPISNLIYDISHPALKVGKAYTFMVQARENSGKDIFKNNGFSAPCYFYYGYPEGGSISLTKPPNDAGLTKNSPQYFQWGPPDNLLRNQQIEYELTVAEYQNGQELTEALENGQVWHQFISPKVGGVTYSNYVPKSEKSMPKDKKFVWQVIAKTGNQTVASSEIFRVDGPPFIDEFWINRNKVLVKKITNPDLNSLSGIGSIVIDEDGNTVDIPFENLTILARSGVYYLESGILDGALDNIIEIDIAPKLTENKKATFLINRVRLSREKDLEVIGKIRWNFPIPTSSSKQEYIESEQKTFRYAKFKLTGSANFVPKSYPLLEPYQYQFNTYASSKFQVLENSFYIVADGNISLPNNIKSNSNSDLSVAYSFSNQEQFFYMEESSTNERGAIQVMEGTNIELLGTEYTIDLSESLSPGKFDGDAVWKGIYFDRFRMQYDLLEQSNATLNFSQAIVQDCQISDRQENKAWVSSVGLELDVEKSFTSSDWVTFNSFPSQLDRIAIKISDNYFESGMIYGAFKIPIISETRDFSYNIPISADGFTDGYMNDDLEGEIFVFNQNGGDNRMEIEIKRAVFENKRRLNMTLEVFWPSFDATITELEGFMVWGNYNVGFYKPNGTIPVYYHTPGLAAGNDITIEAFGAGRDKNLYSFGFAASMIMGEDVAGENGPPKINAFSILENNIIPEDYVPTISMEDDPAYDDVNAAGNSGSYDNIEEEAEADVYAALSGLEDDYETGANNNLNDNTYDYPDSTSNDSTFALTVDGLIQLIDVAMVVANDAQKEKLQELKDKLITYDQSDIAAILRELQANGFSIKKLLSMQVDKLIEKLNENITQEVDKINGKIEGFVLTPVDNNVKKFNARIEKGIDNLFDKVENLAGGSEEVANVIEAARISTKKNVTEEFRSAVLTSVKTNVTDKVTGKIDDIITKNVTTFVATELRTMGDALLEKEFSGDNVNQIVQNSGALLETIGTETFETFQTVSGDGIKETVAKTVTDAYENINWERIAEQIKQDVLEAAEGEAKALLTDAMGEVFNSGGMQALATGVLNNVDLDFSNVGEKLKNGEIGEIVSFDPSYILVETKVAKFEGMMKFTKDDPVWGDSWQAAIEAEFYKPKPFTAKAKYLNGKVDGYNYWFLELAVPSGLATPLVPGVLVMDGIGGKVFKRMRYDRATKDYFPDEATKFGAGLDLYCLDQTMGASLRLKATAELTIYEDYFNMEIRGDMGVGFKEAKADYDFATIKPTVVGTGFIGYNSKDKQLLGEFNVYTNMSPVLCAGGQMGILVKQGYWNVYIGKKSDPIVAKLLCLDAIKFQSWFDLSNEKLELGLQQDVSLWARSPWFNVLNYEVQPYLGFEYHFLAEATILFKPTFKIQEAILDMEVYAAIGTLYKNKVSGKEGDWVLAGAYFAGGAHYKNTDTEAYIKGHLEGKLILVGISIGVDMDLHKDLKQS